MNSGDQRPTVPPVTEIPQKGLERSVVMQRLRDFKADDLDWRTGHVPAYTYYLDEETLAVQREAYGEYIGENALGAGRAFKSLERMSNDIKSMCKTLFHAPEEAGATFTSGGTESVFMALKTARDKLRRERGEPHARYNVVACETAHPCLDKAARMLDIDVIRTQHDAEYRAVPERMRAQIDGATMMLFVSAPNFPFGTFDPVAELAAIATETGIWLHVDGCWGGFLSPFAEKLGYPIPLWDFRVPGITSLSADIHKFGYTAKGASIVIYRSAELQVDEGFSFSGWPRGTYATPSLLGSKAGGAIAAAWAVMNYLGVEGYLRAAKATMDATMQIIEGINAIPGLRCLEPYGEGNIVTFVATDPTLDIYAVADRLEVKGWFRGRMREPRGIQQGVNPAHLGSVAEYLDAVREAIAHVQAAAIAGTAYDESSY